MFPSNPSPTQGSGKTAEKEVETVEEPERMEDTKETKPSKHIGIERYETKIFQKCHWVCFVLVIHCLARVLSLIAVCVPSKTPLGKTIIPLWEVIN